MDRLVAGEQRQVPVGGRAGEDLEMAVALQIAEGPGHVTTDSPMQLPHSLVEFFPEVSELDDLVISLAGEVLAAFCARPVDVLAIERQLLLELVPVELLGED